MKKAMDDDFETVSKPSETFLSYTYPLTIIRPLDFSVFPAPWSVNILDASRLAS